MIRMFFKTRGIFFRKVVVSLSPIMKFRYRASGSVALGGTLVCAITLVAQASQTPMSAVLSATAQPGGVTTILDGVLAATLKVANAGGTATINGAHAVSTVGHAAVNTASLSAVQLVEFLPPEGTVVASLNAVMTTAIGNVGVGSLTATFNAVQLIEAASRSSALCLLSAELVPQFTTRATAVLNGAMTCALSSGTVQVDIGADYTAVLSPVTPQALNLSSEMSAVVASSGQGTSQLQASLSGDARTTPTGAQVVMLSAVLEAASAATQPPAVSLDAVLLANVALVGASAAIDFDGRMTAVMTNPGVHSGDTSVVIIDSLG
jgi:hypothetical protein